MSDCLDDLTAVQFVEGRQTSAARERTIAHLETCEVCDALVNDLLAAERPDDLTTRPDRPGAEARPHVPREATAPALPRLKGPYRLDALIARGGMGEIYRATDTELGRAVAIKIPRVASPGLLRRFEREIAITARLQHPGIVPIHGSGFVEDGTPFYVMRFVEGTALDIAVENAVGRDARLALVPHLVSVAETMAYVHSERIVHRDLKPNNVLLGKFGETVVIDWGLAKQLVDAADRPSKSDWGARIPPTPIGSGATTRAGDVLGTPIFMAPEQAAGEALDERADIYALGVMLAYIVGAIVPRDGAKIDWSGAAAPLEPVYLRATAPKPEHRFATAQAFATALRAALAPDDVPAPAPKRRRLLVAAGLLAVAAPVAFVMRGSSSSAPSPAQLELLDLSRPDLLSIQLSPNGRRVAHTGTDRVEVRDFDTGKSWTRPAWVVWPRSLVWASDDELRYASRLEWESPDVHHVRWDLTRDATTDLGKVTQTPPAWVGDLADARSLFVTMQPVRPQIVGTGTTDVGAGKYPVSLVAIAPDQRRFAFVDPTDRVDSLLRVATTDGTTIDSPPVRDVSALTWQSADSLLYATKDSTRSTLWRVAATPTGLAAPVRLYDHTVADQWIGGLAARSGRILLAIVSSRFESHWFELASGRDHRLPAEDASAMIGWHDDATLTTWNRSTNAIEQRVLAENALPAIMGLMLRGDPANATRANDILVIAQRDDAGRRVIALDAKTGATRWQTDPGVLWFVRCAGDMGPPCVAGARTPSGLTEIRAIDPATGTLGALIVPEANILDIAVDRSGTQLAWIADNTELRTRAFAGTGPGTPFTGFLGSSHSLAFIGDTHDLVLAGNNGNGFGIYRAAGGTVTRIHTTDGTTLSLIRPSPDGTRVSYRTRILSSQLAELHGAR